MRSLNSVGPRLSATLLLFLLEPRSCHHHSQCHCPIGHRPLGALAVGTGGCLSRVWTGAASTPAQMPHALCLHHSHCPLEREPDLAHFPPKHHLPAPPPGHPAGLWEGLQHPATAAASQAPTLHPWWAQPCLTLLPCLSQVSWTSEWQGDDCQSDLCAPGEAHPGRRKKMAEPSFPQSDSEYQPDEGTGRLAGT